MAQDTLRSARVHSSSQAQSKFYHSCAANETKHGAGVAHLRTEQPRAWNCPQAGLLTPRDVPVPHTIGRPGAAGPGAAVDKGLIQRPGPASPAELQSRRREGEASEALETFKLHRRGIKLRKGLLPCATALLAQRPWRAEQPWDGKEGTGLCAPGCRTRAREAVSEETKSRCFTKAHFPGLLSKVN